jgi:hypothetical protein
VAKITKKHEANPELILYAYYSGGEINETVLSKIRAEGIPYYTDRQYWIVWGLDKPKQGKNQSDEDFAAEMAKFNNHQEATNAKIESGEYLRAWRIDDNDFGKPVIIRPTSSNKGAGSDAADDLKKKDERNNELRIEKTLDEVRALYWDKKDEFQANAPLSELELGLMYYLMAHHYVEREIVKESEPVAVNIERILKMTEDEKVAAVRNYLRDRLPGSGHDALCEVTIELYKQYFPEDAAAIEVKHLETYQRREKGIDARIAELAAKK